MDSKQIDTIADSFADNLVTYMNKLSASKTKSLDRTYTGKIMKIEDDGKYRVMFNNQSCLVNMIDDNSHYINESVRIYVPNGNIDKAYAESMSPAPCSNVIISKNQIVFCTKITDSDSKALVRDNHVPDDAVTTYVPIYSATEDGKDIKIQKTEVEEIRVFKLIRDDKNRPVMFTCPDGKVIAVKYSDKDTDYKSDNE